MIANMEWYRVFYTVGKIGNISKAAEELFLTQPAVSHTIKQLEKKLGGQLFFRTSKGVKLTAEGDLLFKYIEQAYHFMETGERKIGEMHQLMAGEVKIGAGDTLCRHYLLPHLESFHRDFPAIRLQVTNRTTLETLALLKEGHIDFGIVNLPLEDKQIHVREGMAIQDGFVAGVRYREQLADRAVSLQELLEYPLILLERGSSTRRYVDRYAESQGVQLRPEFELGSVDLLLQFAGIGLGVACVITDFIGDELRSGKLFEVRLDTPIPPRRIGLITLKDVPVSAAAQRLMSRLL
ncbi:HTH-type transcriptional regulator YofA [Paenibacillus solanacearum]|uniref:HTH-type transcriptional regulator YofA n=1 Tax=Paenibacillus solanacearum TaxID=2048548 RepID=A0A916K3I9_9BACL|nr:LysR family transcriptional regulator [Paenibacillus solanacearum]CAG7620033.1 HTH-type transcriptional regulator YofA [Paenibacillus solanacearum]